ncbi:MAG: hypothetical protein RLZZ293_834, partial [Pseudomonadota bacterium]
DEILLGAELVTDLPTYQFNWQKCWIEKSRSSKQTEFNSLYEMGQERTWSRVKKITPPFESINKANILIIVNEQETSNINYWLKFIDTTQQLANSVTIFTINNELDNLTNLIKDNSIKSTLANYTVVNKLDYIVYLSSATNLANPAQDYFIVQELFNNLNQQTPEFISLSLDNYDVLGIEQLQRYPSVMPGITKSIPTEFLLDNLKVKHIDLLSSDIISNNLIQLIFSCKQDLTAIRGNYAWQADYTKLILNSDVTANTISTNLSQDHQTILITGGLGGVGYGIAKYIKEQTTNSKIILLGRTPQEILRADYKQRLTQLIEDNNRIHYVNCDISKSYANLVTELQQLGVKTLDIVIHSAGVAAKSAIGVKSKSDIKSVFAPKVNGFEGLVNLAKIIEIKTLINCSSVSSIMPSLGNMEYTAANLYLDEISYRNIQGISKILTVNLNQISDIGMAIDFMSATNDNYMTSLDSIRSDELPKLFECILLNDLCCQNIALSRYPIQPMPTSGSELIAQNTKLPPVLEVKIIEENYTELEYKLAVIFSSTLGVTELSIYDDFFKLGGNSILLIKLVSQINKLSISDKSLSIVQLFQAKTIAEISNLLNKNQAKQIIIPKAKLSHIEQAQLSFAQQRLWFIEQYEGGSNAYNIPLLYSLSPVINLPVLNQALISLVNRHQVLRSLIKTTSEGDAYQQVVNLADKPLEIIEHNCANVEEVKNQLNQQVNYVFNLAKEYPIRISLIIYSEQLYLSIVIHHIAFDGWSVDVLQDDLVKYYNYYQQLFDDKHDAQLDLTPLSIQYQDFALWQRSYLTGEVLEQQLNYWKAKLADYTNLNLLTDKPRPQQIDYHGADYLFNLDPVLSQQLR